MRVRLTTLAALAALSTLACAEQAPEMKVSKASILGRKLGRGVVSIDGSSAELGSADPEALSAADFIKRLEKHGGAGRARSARRLIFQHPERALDLLRRADASAELLAVVAAAHDRQCSRGGEAAGWSRVIARRRADPQAFAAYDASRAKLLASLEAGDFERAAGAAIVEEAAGFSEDVLGIDARQLRGVARFMAGDTAGAAEDFAAAVERAARGQPFQASSLLLLLSEARRRLGEGEQSRIAWAGAVEQSAAGLGAGALSVNEPGFWRRALYLKPAGASWPAAVRDKLEKLNRLYGLDWARARTAEPARTEAMLELCLGRWSLERGAPQSALLSFRRAEAFLDARDLVLRQGLRLFQGRALIALDQPGAAAALLTDLARSPAPGVARPALALMGVLSLEREDTKRGLGLLLRALEDDPDPSWVGRGRAEADLGLAYLIAGEEAEGLTWLRRAQGRFERGGQAHLLRQALENERRYQERRERGSEAERLARRLASLEAS